MRRHIALALAAAAIATPAAAMLPPEAYEQARKGAPDVIVIRVTGVGLPAGTAGACDVRGDVVTVERGSAYRAGQTVHIPVSCSSPGAELPVGGTLWIEVARLRAAHTARAFLANGAPARDAFDILD